MARASYLATHKFQAGKGGLGRGIQRFDPSSKGIVLHMVLTFPKCINKEERTLYMNMGLVVETVLKGHPQFAFPRSQDNKIPYDI